MTTPPGRPNRLSRESSPYLLLHAGNPVDWYPWGDEALERARREQRPIFLSVGYSTCYWCHVMERESFSDPAIAERMNRDFVCVKVDREERPDLDDIYMAATQVLAEQGGWPNSVFLTPRLEPFFAGTYFPPADRHGRPGFPDRAGLARPRLARAPGRGGGAGGRGDARDPRLSRGGGRRRRRAARRRGGARGARRAAPALRRHLGRLRRGAEVPHAGPPAAAARARPGAFRGRHDAGGDARPDGARRPLRPAGWRVPPLLGRPANGGCRTSRRCSTTMRCCSRSTPATSPHRCARAGAGGARDGGLPAARARGARGRVLERPRRGDRRPRGAFCAWRRGELEAALGAEDAAFVAPLLGCDGEPFFESDGYVLHLPKPVEVLARERRMTAEEQLLAELAGPRARLLAARVARPRPATDDKILTDWNGLVAGLAVAGRALGEPAWVARAARGAEFLLAAMRPAGGPLRHVWRGGPARLDAYLGDYAGLLRGLLALAEADGAVRWIGLAEEVADEMIARLRAPGAASSTPPLPPTGWCARARSSTGRSRRPTGWSLSRSSSSVRAPERSAGWRRPRPSCALSRRCSNGRRRRPRPWPSPPAGSPPCGLPRRRMTSRIRLAAAVPSRRWRRRPAPW